MAKPDNCDFQAARSRQNELVFGVVSLWEAVTKRGLGRKDFQADPRFFQDTASIPGKTKPKQEFAASDLVMATRAFIEFNPQLKKADEAESLLEREDGATDLKDSFDVGDINDIVKTLKK